MKNETARFRFLLISPNVWVIDLLHLAMSIQFDCDLEFFLNSKDVPPELKSGPQSKKVFSIMVSPEPASSVPKALDLLSEDFNSELLSEGLKKICGSGGLPPPPAADSKISISIDVLKKQGRCPSDIYISLSSTKFVKIFNKDDLFDEEDWSKFSEQKKVHFLHAELAPLKSMHAWIESQLKEAISLEVKKLMDSSLEPEKPKKVENKKSEKEKEKVPTPEKVPEKSEAKSPPQKLEKVEIEKEKTPEKPVKKAQEKVLEKVPEKAAEKAPEKPTKPPKEEKKENPATEESVILPKRINELKESLGKAMGKDPTQLLNAIRNISSELGFTAETQAAVKHAMSQAVDTAKKNPKLKDLLGSLERNPDLYIASHSQMVGQVACLLAGQMDWKSDATYQKLTFAAMMHDITIKNQRLAAVQSIKELEDRKSEFNEEEINSYKTHAMNAAQLSRTFDEVPPDVDVILAEHHERPNGEGFPRGLAGSRIGPLSAVFIVAHDFVDEMYRLDSTSKLDASMLRAFFEKYKASYEGGNFKKLLKAVEKLKM